MNIKWHVTDNYFSLRFDRPVRVLSSAILGGGMQTITSFINLRVDENFEGKRRNFPPPGRTLADTVATEGLPEPSAGMMTAASMNSFQYRSRSFGGIDIYCFLTSGLSNALAPGDPGEFRPSRFFSDYRNSRLGTINIAVGMSCALTPAAMTEAVLIATEAKSSVLFDRGVKSYISGRQATGTGTDSILVFCAGIEDYREGEAEQFCGKHTILGELLGSVVRDALSESIKGDAVFGS